MQGRRQLQRQCRFCARHLDGDTAGQFSLPSPCHHKPLPTYSDSPGPACCEDSLLKNLLSVLSLLLVSAHWQLQTRMLRCLLSLRLQLGKPCRRPAKQHSGSKADKLGLQSLPMRSWWQTETLLQQAALLWLWRACCRALLVAWLAQHACRIESPAGNHPEATLLPLCIASMSGAFDI